MTNIVSGVVSTITDLGKDEAFLQGWLKEQPSRLGLGDLEVTEGVADEDDRSFAATDDDHWEIESRDSRAWRRTHFDPHAVAARRAAIQARGQQQ